MVYIKPGSNTDLKILGEEKCLVHKFLQQGVRKSAVAQYAGAVARALDLGSTGSQFSSCSDMLLGKGV